MLNNNKKRKSVSENQCVIYNVEKLHYIFLNKPVKLVWIV